MAAREGQGAALLQEFPGIGLQRSPIPEPREMRVGRAAPPPPNPSPLAAHTDPVWPGRFSPERSSGLRVPGLFVGSARARPVSPSPDS